LLKTVNPNCELTACTKAVMALSAVVSGWLSSIIFTTTTLAAVVQNFQTNKPGEQLQRACYKDVGCFDNAGSFKHMKVLPQSPNEINTTFLLFTPESKTNATILTKTLLLSSAKTEQVNWTNDMFVLVHGFGQFPFWAAPMKDALVDQNNNVIIVDWTSGSIGPNYYQAASNTRVVGAVLADFVSTLVKSFKISLNRLTLVGFSLGAHACGFAGKNLGGLSRINFLFTGLDPAGPLFSGKESEARLDSSDAEFVQCIHTNGQSFFKGGLGSVQPMGHVDFYANGGLVQSGCADGLEEIILDLFHLNGTILEELTCSHSQAPVLYIETIKSSSFSQACQFTSVSCDSPSSWFQGKCFNCIANGDLPAFGYKFKAQKQFKGQYYFTTLPKNNHHETYCGKQYGFNIIPDQAVKGSITLTLMFNSLHSMNFTFQHIDETLEQNNHAIKIGAVPEFYPKITNISIIYEKYSSWIWKNGPDEWVLKSLTLLDMECNIHEVNPNILVINKMATTVDM
ncbi:Lipase member H, partial [Trichinella pseudospiralis]